MAKRLQTAAQVIEALGGLNAVASMCGLKYNAVYAWRQANKFPPRTYVLLQRALEARRASAPAYLWGMIGPSF